MTSRFLYWFGGSLALLCLMGNTPGGVSKPATLKGRVVISWTCGPASNTPCKGIGGVSVLLLSGDPPACACEPGCPGLNKVLLQRKVTAKDGAFELTGLERGGEARVLYCKIGCEPYPDIRSHHLDTEINQVTVELWKTTATGDEVHAFSSAFIARAEAGDKQKALSERYADEWKALEAHTFPTATRVTLARAVAAQVKSTDLVNASELNAAASVDPNALEQARRSLRAAVAADDKTREAATLKVQRASVPQDLLRALYLEERAKQPGRSGEWTALASDLGVSDHTDADMAADKQKKPGVELPAEAPAEGTERKAERRNDSDYKRAF